MPLASVLSAGGNWDRAFMFSASITIVAAIVAKFVLLPLRLRFIENAKAQLAVESKCAA